MSDDERLIQLIYEGAQDDASWSLALTKVAERLRAVGVGLGIQDMKTHRFRSLGQIGIDTGLNAIYQPLAPGNRIWQEIAVRKQALADQMVVAKSELVRTELYADWFAPQRFHSVMAAPTLFERDASAVLVAFRDQPRGDFELADLAQAERFAGHFGAALRFRFAQERTEAELATVNLILDELPDAIFLVDRTGRLQHANAAGRAMLASGAPVRLHQGRLEIHRPMFAERLQQLIVAGSGELRVPKQGHRSWIFRLSASTRQCGPVHADAMILRIIDPDRTGEALDSTKLNERLGLTVRQAQAVAALVKWGAEDLASAELRISKATLHTHVSHAYDRLGVHNRAALVALLASHGFDVASGEKM